MVAMMMSRAENEAKEGKIWDYFIRTLKCCLCQAWATCILIGEKSGYADKHWSGFSLASSLAGRELAI